MRVKKQGWIHIYRDGKEIECFGVFKDKTGAMAEKRYYDNYFPYYRYVDTIQIEWEEEV